MSRDEDRGPIFIVAEACLIAFKRCLSSNPHPIVDASVYSSIEDQMARYSIWASNMAVFDTGKYCLDDRLQGANDVQRLVLGILEVLKYRIIECKIAISLLNATQEQDSKSSLTPTRDEIERTLKAVASQVGLLHEASNEIQTFHSHSHDDFAAKSFRLTDQLGHDSEVTLRNSFGRDLRERFPATSLVVRERIVATMILRRKRIMYRWAQKSIVLIKPRERIAETRFMSLPPLGQSQQNEKLGSYASPRTGESSRATDTVDSSVFASTILDREGLKTNAVQVTPHVRVRENNTPEYLYFPPSSPSPGSRSGKLGCPYCLCALPAADFVNPERWKNHVSDDLDPFVCLFEHCDEAETLYGRKQDWLRHMRKHTRYWCCPVKSHASQKFARFEDFLQHMEVDHKKSYTESQTELLAERGIYSAEQLFMSCPLCEFTEDANEHRDNMIGHIMDHLTSLALESLPSLDLLEAQSGTSEFASRYSPPVPLHSKSNPYSRQQPLHNRYSPR